MSAEFPPRLRDLPDVDVADLADGQVLAYDEAIGMWFAEDVEGTGGGVTQEQLTAEAAARAAADASHASDTTAIHGIADTSALVVTSDPRLSDPRAPTAHDHDDRYFTEAEITAALAAKQDAATAATDAELSAHAADTTAVHGIADTSALALTGDPRFSNARVPVMASATIMLGDSITEAQTTSGGGLTGTRTAYDPLVWADIESGGRIFYQRNAGIGGNVSADVLARMQADVIAHNPGWCVLLIGTNDAALAVPLATYAANVSAIVAALTNAGIRVCLCTIPPRGASSASVLDRTIEHFNTWLRRFAAGTVDVVLADVYRALINPANAGTVAIYDADTVHPTVAGAHQIGRVIAQAMLPHLGGYVPPLASHNVTAHTDSLLPNGVFVGAGTPAGLAAGWTDYYLGPYGVVPTLRTEPGILGNVQRLTTTAGPALGGFTATLDPAGWEPGDVLQWSFRVGQHVPVDGGYWSVLVYFELPEWPGIVLRYPLFTPYAMTGPTMDQDFALVPHTREFIVPAGATSATVAFNVSSVTTPGAWLDVAEMSLYNLTALGVAPVAA